MKITIERNKFQTALNTVGAVAGSGTLTVLQNVKMETKGDDELLLTATNLDQTVSTVVKCQIGEPGATTVPAKLIVQMVSAMTASTVEFNHAENSDGKAVLTGGDVTYKIATINVKEFPQQTEVNGKEIVFTQPEIKEIFRKTAFAASLDNTRRSLTSVCIQTKGGFVTAVATDGRRLAHIKVAKEVEDGMEVIVPIASVKYIQRLLGDDGDVKVSVDSGKAIKFSTNDWMVQTKLVDDVYPNWRQVVPAELNNHIDIDREIFASAVRQVSLSSSTSNTNIAVSLKEGMMTLTASTDSVSDAKTMIPVKFDGEEIKICFNPYYILDVLGAYDSDAVTLNISNGMSPVTITSSEADCFTVVMPLRIN